MTLNVKSFNRHMLTVLLPEVFQPAGKSIFSSSPLTKLFFSPSRENPSVSYRILQQRRMFTSKDKWTRGQHHQKVEEEGERGRSQPNGKENNVTM